VLAARAAATAQDIAEAERLLRRAIQLDSQAAEAYTLLGQILGATGRLDEARQEFTRLQGSQPATAHTMLGLIDEAQGKPAAAAARYARALRAHPQAALAANNLAWLRLSEANTEEAVRLARIAQQQLPEQPEINDTLGWMLHKAGRHDAAIQYLTRAVERAPAKALYRHHLGMSYLGAGDEPQGRANLQRALALDPAFPGHEEARAALASSETAATGAEKAALTARGGR
jgi:Tfp pilus assembly protein PilF